MTIGRHFVQVECVLSVLLFGFGSVRAQNSHDPLYDNPVEPCADVGGGTTATEPGAAPCDEGAEQAVLGRIEQLLHPPGGAGVGGPMVMDLSAVCPASILPIDFSHPATGGTTGGTWITVPAGYFLAFKIEGSDHEYLVLDDGYLFVPREYDSGYLLRKGPVEWDLQFSAATAGSAVEPCEPETCVCTLENHPCKRGRPVHLVGGECTCVYEDVCGDPNLFPQQTCYDYACVLAWIAGPGGTTIPAWGCRIVNTCCDTPACEGPDNCDHDGDGVRDGGHCLGPDNCWMYNPDQADLDGDGIGDLCDGDIDGDGVWNGLDNCPFADNANQSDTNANGIGDACEPEGDTDGDGRPDSMDNCPATPNPYQGDVDGDGLGDACDADIDGDHALNVVDNCPTMYNPGQADFDGDRRGDACDWDIDGDRVWNPDDNCLFTPNPDQADSDQDGYGDACDNDWDNDGTLNDVDNCPTARNPSQTDVDGDGLGDACDLDLDGDGVANGIDNCVFVYNPLQADSDGDGRGDACEAPGLAGEDCALVFDVCCGIADCNTCGPDACVLCADRGGNAGFDPRCGPPPEGLGEAVFLNCFGECEQTPCRLDPCGPYCFDLPTKCRAGCFDNRPDLRSVYCDDPCATDPCGPDCTSVPAKCLAGCQGYEDHPCCKNPCCVAPCGAACFDPVAKCAAGCVGFGPGSPCCQNPDPCRPECGGASNPCCRWPALCCDNPHRCCRSSDPCTCSEDPCSAFCDPDPCDPACGGDPCSAECGGLCNPACTDCDDGNPCTIDTCEDGVCSHECMSDCAECGSGTACLGCACAPVPCDHQPICEAGIGGAEYVYVNLDDDADVNDVLDLYHTIVSPADDEMKALALSWSVDCPVDAARSSWSVTVEQSASPSAGQVLLYNSPDKSGGGQTSLSGPWPPPTVVYVEGITPSADQGDVAVRFEINVQTPEPCSKGCGDVSDPHHLTVYQIDLDADSDNDGSVGEAVTDNDDVTEDQSPGMIIAINDDDDDGDEIPDNADGAINGANDLQDMYELRIRPYRVHLPPSDQPDLLLRKSGSGRVRIFDGSSLTELLGPDATEAYLHSSPVDRTFLVEGVTPGTVNLTLTDLCGEYIDTVSVSVPLVEVVPHRTQRPAPTVYLLPMDLERFTLSTNVPIAEPLFYVISDPSIARFKIGQQTAAIYPSTGPPDDVDIQSFAKGQTDLEFRLGSASGELLGKVPIKVGGEIIFEFDTLPTYTTPPGDPALRDDGAPDYPNLLSFPADPLYPLHQEGLLIPDETVRALGQLSNAVMSYRITVRNADDQPMTNKAVVVLKVDDGSSIYDPHQFAVVQVEVYTNADKGRVQGSLRITQTSPVAPGNIPPSHWRCVALAGEVAEQFLRGEINFDRLLDISENHRIADHICTGHDIRYTQTFMEPAGERIECSMVLRLPYAGREFTGIITQFFENILSRQSIIIGPDGGSSPISADQYWRLHDLSGLVQITSDQWIPPDTRLFTLPEYDDPLAGALPQFPADEISDLMRFLSAVYQPEWPGDDFPVGQEGTKWALLARTLATEIVLSLIPLVGDGRDIATEIWNWVSGREVGTFTLSLAAIGLTADVASFFGVGIPANVIVAITKALHKALPAGTIKRIVSVCGGGWRGFRLFGHYIAKFCHGLETAQDYVNPLKLYEPVRNILRQLYRIIDSPLHLDGQHLAEAVEMLARRGRALSDDAAEATAFLMKRGRRQMAETLFTEFGDDIMEKALEAVGVLAHSNIADLSDEALRGVAVAQKSLADAGLSGDALQKVVDFARGAQITAQRAELAFANLNRLEGVEGLSDMVEFLKRNRNNVDGIDGAIYESTVARRILDSEVPGSGALQRISNDGFPNQNRVDTLTSDFAVQIKSRGDGNIGVGAFGGNVGAPTYFRELAQQAQALGRSPALMTNQDLTADLRQLLEELRTEEGIDILHIIVAH